MFGLRELRMDRVVVRAQDHDFVGSKSDLVLDMCIKLGADAYIFGGEGKSYADVHAFESAGVTPSFLNFVGSEYPQMHGAFIPKMSFLDLLFNCGPNSREVLNNCKVSFS